MCFCLVSLQIGPLYFLRGKGFIVDALFIPLKNPSMKHIMSKTEKLMHYILILKVVSISFILFSSSDAREQLT